MITSFLIGYTAFMLGSVLYLLQKVQDYKKQAKEVAALSFSMSTFWSDEWINIARLLIGGVALVIGLPMLIGGSTVDLNNASGNTITTISLKNALLPMYFVIGYSGNSVLFALFGKYKKTFVNQLGVEDDK